MKYIAATPGTAQHAAGSLPDWGGEHLQSPAAADGTSLAVQYKSLGMVSHYKVFEDMETTY
jgi:hypothetical protein